MDHNQVQLIGVGGDPETGAEQFAYTVDAPNNLWVGAIVDDGTRMGIKFMASLLNGLIDNDQYFDGGVYAIRSGGPEGPILVAWVGEEVPKGDVQANLADTATVRVVRVRVVPPNAKSGMVLDLESPHSHWNQP